MFKTTTGGNSWNIISPDLTRTEWDVPPSVGIYLNNNLKTMPQRGVIYTVAPSNKNINTIWAGTDDGLLQITNDAGKTWKNITPPEISSWNKISMIDAGHTDDLTAYAAVNKIRLDDLYPYIFKTHDGGKTWKKIVTGLPGDPINTVREDPFCKGLLFAGSETAVYVSFNDGDNWQPLRLNMPATSIRDLVIKDNDLVIGTHGRSFWILDDITALRDIAKKGNQSQGLHTIATAYRVRWNMNTDTPLPQEEPAGQNPPDGAVIDYYTDGDSSTAVTMEILDAAGKTMRSFSSNDKPYDLPPVNIPLYWIRPQQLLSAKKGAHRFVWDMHTTPLDVPVSYAIAAIYGQTAPNPTSPWVLPGHYTVKLTIAEKVYSQPLVIKMDPRVKTTAADLQKQYVLSNQCYTELKSLSLQLLQMKKIQSQIKQLLPAATGPVLDSLQKMDTAMNALSGMSRQAKQETMGTLRNSLTGLLYVLQESDMPLTRQAETAVAQTTVACRQLALQYKKLTESGLQSLNNQLINMHLNKITL